VVTSRSVTSGDGTAEDMDGRIGEFAGHTAALTDTLALRDGYVAHADEGIAEIQLRVPVKA